MNAHHINVLEMKIIKKINKSMVLILFEKSHTVIHHFSHDLDLFFKKKLLISIFFCAFEKNNFLSSYRRRPEVLHVSAQESYSLYTNRSGWVVIASLFNLKVRFPIYYYFSNRCLPLSRPDKD